MEDEGESEIAGWLAQIASLEPRCLGASLAAKVALRRDIVDLRVCISTQDGTVQRQQELAHAKVWLAEAELRAAEDELRVAGEELRVAKANNGDVAEAKVGVAEAKVGVAEAKVGVAEAKVAAGVPGVMQALVDAATQALVNAQNELARQQEAAHGAGLDGIRLQLSGMSLGAPQAADRMSWRQWFATQQPPSERQFLGPDEVDPPELLERGTAVHEALELLRDGATCLVADHRFPHVFTHAPPGLGKTALLRHLCRMDLAEDALGQYLRVNITFNNMTDYLTAGEADYLTAGEAAHELARVVVGLRILFVVFDVQSSMTFLEFVQMAQRCRWRFNLIEVFTCVRELFDDATGILLCVDELQRVPYWRVVLREVAAVQDRIAAQNLGWRVVWIGTSLVREDFVFDDHPDPTVTKSSGRKVCWVELEPLSAPAALRAVECQGRELDVAARMLVRECCGHLRALQYVAGVVNSTPATRTISELRSKVVALICNRYESSEWHGCFDKVARAALLGTHVAWTAVVGRAASGEVTYERLACLGAIFNRRPRGDTTIVPHVSPLWMQAGCTDEDLKALLRAVSPSADRMGSLEFETYHAHWELLLQYVRLTECEQREVEHKDEDEDYGAFVACSLYHLPAWNGCKCCDGMGVAAPSAVCRLLHITDPLCLPPSWGDRLMMPERAMGLDSLYCLAPRHEAEEPPLVVMVQNTSLRFQDIRIALKNSLTVLGGDEFATFMEGRIFSTAEPKNQSPAEWHGSLGGLMAPTPVLLHRKKDKSLGEVRLPDNVAESAVLQQVRAAGAQVRLLFVVACAREVNQNARPTLHRYPRLNSMVRLLDRKDLKLLYGASAAARGVLDDCLAPVEAVAGAGED